MKARVFFDTNILVYSDDADSPGKQNRAIELIGQHYTHGSMIISLQVLQEYFVTVTRKLGVSARTAQRKVQILAQGRVVRFEPADIVSAIELHRLEQISFWDAMIIHAARMAGCDILYTEDLQHGVSIAGIRIVNPFHS